jgi:hypothetical protein
VRETAQNFSLSSGANSPKTSRYVRSLPPSNSKQRRNYIITHTLLSPDVKRRSREWWSCKTSNKTRTFAPVRVRVRARTPEKEIKKMEDEDYATLCRLSQNAPSFSQLPTIQSWGLPACLPKCARLFSMIASSLKLGLMRGLKQKCSSRWAEHDAKNGSSIEQKG